METLLVAEDVGPKVDRTISLFAGWWCDLAFKSGDQLFVHCMTQAPYKPPANSTDGFITPMAHSDLVPWIRKAHHVAFYPLPEGAQEQYFLPEHESHCLLYMDPNKNCFLTFHPLVPENGYFLQLKSLLQCIFCSIFLLVQTGLTIPRSSCYTIVVADKGNFLLLYFLFYIPIPLLLLWMRVTIFLAIYLQPHCKLAPFTSTLKIKAIHSFEMWRSAYNNYMASQLRRPQTFFKTTTIRLSLQLAGHKLKLRSVVLQIYNLILEHQSVFKIIYLGMQFISTFNILRLILKVEFDRLYIKPVCRKQYHAEIATEITWNVDTQETETKIAEF